MDGLYIGKEKELRRQIGIDPLSRKPLLYYAYDLNIFSDYLYKTVGDMLDKKGDHLPWIKQHPFIFSLCLVRRFFEKSNGVKYNLFGKNLHINKELDSSFDGVFHFFDSDCDRRFNFHKILVESFFFFGAKTSQIYAVLSHIRQEFERAENIEDAYRTILSDETTLPFAYDYLLQVEDPLFRELLCGKHIKNTQLQNIVTNNLSRLLRDSSANTGWVINWSAKTLDVVIERLVLADGHISNLTVKCNGKSPTYPLDRFRYETVDNKRRFPTIRISELFKNLPLQSGCEVSLGHAYKKTVNELFRTDAPLIFRKTGDIARLWIPNEDGTIKKEDVLRASELILLERNGAVHDIRLGDEFLSLDRKSISLGECRFSAVLISVNQQHGENAKPLIVDGIQLCRVGVRPRFEIVDQTLRIQSCTGDLFCEGENTELQLNSQELFNVEKLKITGSNYSVSGNRILFKNIPENILAYIIYDKIKTRILQLPLEYKKIEDTPMQEVVGFWEPHKPEWTTPGKTIGTLFLGSHQLEAWIPWDSAQYAWKKNGIGYQWEYGQEETFDSLKTLAEYCVELWLPVRGKLKLGEIEIYQLEEGLNSIRFDALKMKNALRQCLQNIETVGTASTLHCHLEDGSCMDIAQVTMEPIEPILIKIKESMFSVYLPYDVVVENWNVCVLDEHRIAQPVKWLELAHGRNDFNVEMNEQCCWVVLCQGNDWKSDWIDFLVQAAGRTPTDVLSFVPLQRAPLNDRLSNIEDAGEQLGLIKGFLIQFDERIFQETLDDTRSENSGIHISRVSINMIQQMFHENLSLESIEKKVEQVLLAGFNIFSIRSMYMDWIDGICGKWTQIQKGTVAQLWQKCSFFPAMELLRNRFPLLGDNSDVWKKFYSGKNNCNRNYLKLELNEYFPSKKIRLSLDGEVLDVWSVDQRAGRTLIQIKKNGTSRPIYFSAWQKTIQLPTTETGFSLYDIDEECIYPLMSENLCSAADYKKNKKTKMYLSKKMYRCAYYEACVITEQLVFSNNDLEYLYKILSTKLNLTIIRDQILNAILTRCYKKYQLDKCYANRLAVLVLAVFSRRRYHFSDCDHQIFMKGMLRAYRICRRLLMNDLIAVEFFRVWFSRK